MVLSLISSLYLLCFSKGDTFVLPQPIILAAEILWCLFERERLKISIGLFFLCSNLNNGGEI